MRSQTLRRTAALLLVAVLGGTLYALMPRKDGETSAADEGFDDLASCSFLTSIDSRRSLYLSASHKAKLSDRTGTALRWESGTWHLLDDDAHVYGIEIGGETRTYTLVSAPEGEGCMLVAGPVDHADLKASWFSSLTAPK